MAGTAYHVVRDGVQLDGTHSAEEVAAMMREAPAAAFLVWCEGMSGWADPRTVDAIAALLGPGTGEPAAAGPPAAPAAAARGPLTERLGFVRSLFDLSFTSYVTPRMIQALYVLGMAAVALGLLVAVVSGAGTFVSGLRFSRFGMAVGGLLWIVLAPVLALVELALLRMFLELVMVLFAVKEDLGRIAGREAE